MKNIVVPILLIVAGVVGSLAVVEVGFRALNIGEAAAPSWSDRPTAYFKHQAAATLQDYPYTPTKEEGAFRIAVLGDSFTFAPQMQFYDAYPKQLERLLNLNTDTPKVEVINYGVPGYSAIHAAQTLKNVLEEEPDLVLLQITLNDPQTKLYAPTGISGKNVFGAYKPTGVLAKRWKSLGYFLERVHNSGTKDRYINFYFNLFQHPKLWKGFRSAIKRIREKTARSKVKVAAVIFPLFGLPLDEQYPFHPLHEKIHEHLTKRKIPYLDLFDLYKGIPLQRIQLVPHEDFHPNEIAHRMAAEEIHRWLLKLGHVPAEFRPQEQFKTRLNIYADKNEPLALAADVVP